MVSDGGIKKFNKICREKPNVCKQTLASQESFNKIARDLVMYINDEWKEGRITHDQFTMLTHYKNKIALLFNKK